MHIEQARVLQDTGNRIGHRHRDRRLRARRRGRARPGRPRRRDADGPPPRPDAAARGDDRRARAARRARPARARSARSARSRSTRDSSTRSPRGSASRSTSAGPVDDAYRGVARDIAAFAEQAAERARDDARSTASARRCPPTPMDERIVDALEAAAQATGEPYMRMHSGAAHDTMCVADRVPTAMVFVPCKDGISHHPAEDASPADAALAAEIILNAIRRSRARRRSGPPASRISRSRALRAARAARAAVELRRRRSRPPHAHPGSPTRRPAAPARSRPRPRTSAARSPARSGSCGGCGRSSSRRRHGRRGTAPRTPPARATTPGRSCGPPTTIPPPHSSARAGKSGSKRRNMNCAQAGMFDQIARPSAPSGAMSPVETSSGTTMSTRPAISSGSGGTARRRDDVRALLELDPAAVLRRQDDLAVVDLRVGGRRRQLRQPAELARVGDPPMQRGRRRGRRRAEVDAVAGRPAAPGEVAVERAHRDGAGRGCLAHADARAAGGLEDARPGGEQVGVDAAAHDHVEDLPRARRDGQVELGRDRPAPQHRRDDREILERRVDRGADAHLPRRLAGRLPHGHDVPR